MGYGFEMDMSGIGFSALWFLLVALLTGQFLSFA
jgi:hypothetical protein